MNASKVASYLGPERPVANPEALVEDSDEEDTVSFVNCNASFELMALPLAPTFGVSRVSPARGSPTTRTGCCT